MFLDRCERNYQSIGDLLVGGPLREQVQDLLFALSKRLKELLCSSRGRSWQSFGDRRDDLLRRFLTLLVCKGGKHGRGIGSKGRWEREGLLLHGLKSEQCLECLLHRFSSIEKDAHVSFRLCQYEQVKKNVERILWSPRHLQSGYLQRQDRDHTSHSRNLLSS